MFADWSVEMSAAADEPIVVVPWQGNPRGADYVDLRAAPEKISSLPEAAAHPALAEALRLWNADGAPWRTLKCDAYAMEPERLQAVQLEMDLYADRPEAAYGFSSYVDVALLELSDFVCMTLHESLMHAMTNAAREVPLPFVAAEFVLRRCIQLELDRDGFCISIYVHGLGSDETAAYARWQQAFTALLLLLPQTAAKLLPSAS